MRSTASPSSSTASHRYIWWPAINPTESQTLDHLGNLGLARRDCGLVAVGDSHVPGGVGWISTMRLERNDDSAPMADLASVLGHADRVRPFEDYCVGLLSAEGRTSVEPLAAVTAPERPAAQHQSLLHLVAQAPWSDQAVLSRVHEHVLPSIT
jgi:hypothetical protein